MPRPTDANQNHEKPTVADKAKSQLEAITVTCAAPNHEEAIADTEKWWDGFLRSNGFGVEKL